MQRLIITGPNGAGKSWFAEALAEVCPGLAPVSYDALRLTRDWQKRPAAEIEAALQAVVARDHWVLEGGPSLLRGALPRAEGVVWLDPPRRVLAARLLRRPWVNRGRTRAELPEGNVDWVGQQYRFGWASLRKFAQFRTGIEQALVQHPQVPVWRCRTVAETDTAVREIGLSLRAKP